MPNPNKFEQAILKAAVSAQKFHVKMTGGWYLWYTHESFLQNYMAIQLFKKTGHCIYVDASPKKIRESSATVSNKQPMNPRQRFDLVCWLKSEDRVKSIIEIKLRRAAEGVTNDINKVSEYLTKDGKGIQGYVLYYTDHERIEKWDGDDGKFIRNRFETVLEECYNVRLCHGIDDYIFDKKGEDPWGFALFRVN